MYSAIVPVRVKRVLLEPSPSYVSRVLQANLARRNPSSRTAHQEMACARPLRQPLRLLPRLPLQLLRSTIQGSLWQCRLCGRSRPSSNVRRTAALPCQIAAITQVAGKRVQIQIHHGGRETGTMYKNLPAPCCVCVCRWAAWI